MTLRSGSYRSGDRSPWARVQFGISSLYAHYRSAEPPPPNGRNLFSFRLVLADDPDTSTDDALEMMENLTYWSEETGMNSRLSS